ncbi:ras-related protein Rab-42-like [Triplophysa rosa]|uniref:ras-related protein Rab-42-like n=1 Tax=Triplophysa rosa TaxID=992332 RepID=UPI0025462A3D|nr:ras-related protein Rab-42-like [Triplophysa rosa]
MELIKTHHQEVEPGVKVELQLLEAGDEFWPATHNCLPGVKGILLVFDLGSRTSFEHAEYLHREMCSMKHLDTVLCQQDWQAPYFEVSAKTGHNVAEIFELLTRRIYQGMLSG